jgi:hypothetical protein
MGATSKGTDFRGITGDIDFLAILNLDGTFIKDQAKRVRIYEALQKLLGMQHGESFSFIGGKRTVYLKDIEEGAEAGVTISPGNQAHASHFVENVSIAIDSPNVGKRLSNPTGDWLLIAGFKYDWRAKTNLFSTIAISSLSDTLRSFYNLPAFFIPGLLYRFIDNLTESQIDPKFDGENGAAIRPDGNGGLEQYARGGSSVPTIKLFSGSATFADVKQKGEWVPISVADALALGPNPAKLELVPMTQLPNRSLAGDKRVEVLALDQLAMSPTSPWFQVGDEVIIDPGEPNEERVLVSALGSLVFEQPLVFDHPEGATVILAPRSDISGVGGTGVIISTSTTSSTAPLVTTSAIPQSASTLVFPAQGLSSATSTSAGAISQTTTTTQASVLAAPASMAAAIGNTLASGPLPTSSAELGETDQLLSIGVPVAPAVINDSPPQTAQPVAYTGGNSHELVALALLALVTGILLCGRRRDLVD